MLEQFDDGGDLSQLDAELVGVSLGMGKHQQPAVITTDVFELSFFYGNFSSHVVPRERHQARAGS